MKRHPNQTENVMLNSKIRLPLGLLLLASLQACNQSSTPAATAPAAASAPSVAFAAKDVFMSVNGEQIDRALVLAYAKERGFDLTDPTQVQLAAEKLAEFVAVVQNGKSQAFGASPEFALQQLKSDAAIFLEQMSNNPPLTDADVEASYKAQVAATGGVQLNLQQIVFNDRMAAQSAQTALAGGRAFADLMVELRSGPGVREVKDWGFTTVISLPEPLRAPVLALQAGGYTPEAIPLGDIYYLVNVSGSKELAVPDFATVKEGLRKSMMQTRAQEAVAKIKAQTKVEVR